MDNERKRFDMLIETLGRERDELRLKVQLGKAEVRDEWEKLEGRWNELRPRLQEAGKVTAETTQNLGTAAGIAIEEIRTGYRRIRDALR